MTTVYAVIEYLPIGANGVTGEAVLSEHPTPEGAVAAKDALYAQRPELVGCLAIRSFDRQRPFELVAEVTETVETEGVDARPVAGGAVSGADGLRRQGAGGGHRPPVQPLR